MTTVWFKIKCFWQEKIGCFVQCFWRWIFPCFDVMMFGKHWILDGSDDTAVMSFEVVDWMPLWSSFDWTPGISFRGRHHWFCLFRHPRAVHKKWCTLKSGVLWSFCPASLCCTLLGIPNTLQHRLQWSVVTNVTKNTSIIRTSPKGLPSWLYQWFCENQFMYCDKTNNCKSLDLDCFQETIHIYTVKMMKSRRMRMQCLSRWVGRPSGARGVCGAHVN